MRKKWLTGGALLCVLALPVQFGAVANAAGSGSPGGASPPPGSRAPDADVSAQEGNDWAGVETVAGRSISKVGDRDNFGYGRGSGPPPCDFFDNREPEDLGVFDYELLSGDEVDTWTHTFAVTGTPTKVKLLTWEMFADPETAATIDIDGVTMDFEQGMTAVCGEYPEGGVRNVFTLSGAAAAAAADGVITVTFHENGDDIAIDRAKLTVTFA